MCVRGFFSLPLAVVTVAVFVTIANASGADDGIVAAAVVVVVASATTVADGMACRINGFVLDFICVSCVL